jgi:hypothetical protein
MLSWCLSSAQADNWIAKTHRNFYRPKPKNANVVWARLALVPMGGVLKIFLFFLTEIAMILFYNYAKNALKMAFYKSKRKKICFKN